MEASHEKTVSEGDINSFADVSGFPATAASTCRKTCGFSLPSELATR